MFGVEFYPTPPELAALMVEGIDFKKIHTVLDAGAGKGDLTKLVRKKLKAAHKSKSSAWEIDCVEIDYRLRLILRGENFAVVHDDFLTYETYKQYDLIVMNPPFGCADEFLMRALEMQRQGGKIVCLMSASRYRNANSMNYRQIHNIAKLRNAETIFVEHAFDNAERPTKAEVVIVKFDMPRMRTKGKILQHLQHEYMDQRSEGEDKDFEDIAKRDFLPAFIDSYNFLCKAGVRMIREWRSLRPQLKVENLLNEKERVPIELKLGGETHSGESMQNQYLRNLRMIFWEKLFLHPGFMGLFTSDIRDLYLGMVHKLGQYEFSKYNIATIRLELDAGLVEGMEKSIMKQYDEYSRVHAYLEETGNNIHYFNGWKTNKAHKVNEKIIFPCHLYGYSDRLNLRYSELDKLVDLEKVLIYLDGGSTGNSTLTRVLSNCFGTKNIQCKYFTVSFFKKGTCHLTFTNEDLLRKFNLYGCLRKGWLPPNYGKRAYEDLSQEEAAVVNSYETREEYEDIVARSEFFLSGPHIMNRLQAYVPDEEQPIERTA